MAKYASKLESRMIALALGSLVASASLGASHAFASGNTYPSPATITRSDGSFFSSVRISGVDPPSLSYEEKSSDPPLIVSALVLDGNGYTMSLPSYENKIKPSSASASAQNKDQMQIWQIPWEINWHKQFGIFGMKIFLWNAQKGIPTLKAAYSFLMFNNETGFHVAEISAPFKAATAENNISPSTGKSLGAATTGVGGNFGAICTEDPPSNTDRTACEWLVHLTSSPRSHDLTNLMTEEKLSVLEQLETKYKASTAARPPVDLTGGNIGFVAPTFTGAAYDNSFYIFYVKAISAGSQNTAAYTNYLTNRISSYVNNPATYPMYSYATTLRKSLPNANITMLTDTDVDAGKIFHTELATGKQLNSFDVLVIGHEEYVTQQEYDNFKQFVANGGSLVIMDGNVFFAEIKYDRFNQVVLVPNEGNVTLVEGHWWVFDGKTARPSVAEKWYSENADWVGSNYVNIGAFGGKFTNNLFDYKPHEEQELKNPKAIILVNYGASIPGGYSTGQPLVCAYELAYGKGKVIGLGLFFDDLAWNEKAHQFFSSVVTNYALHK